MKKYLGHLVLKYYLKIYFSKSLNMPITNISDQLTVKQVIKLGVSCNMICINLANFKCAYKATGKVNQIKGR